MFFRFFLIVLTIRFRKVLLGKLKVFLVKQRIVSVKVLLEPLWKVLKLKEKIC